MAVSRPKGIPKPYPTFPLFAHACGSWKAKIDGRQQSFGPTRPANHPEYRATWQAALDRYHELLEARAKGLHNAARPFDNTLREVINAYLAEKHERTETGELDVRTFAEARGSLTDYGNVVGLDRTIAQLEADPDTIRVYLKALRIRLGVHAYNRTVRSVAAMWNWAGSPSRGILGRPFKWVELHEIRSVREVRRRHREDRAEGVLRSWTVPEIHAMLRYARQPLKAAILLGYYAAYGNTDISEVPTNALTVYQQAQRIHFHGRNDEIPAGWGMIYFPRPKTEMDRYAIVPPEVVTAIGELRGRKATPQTRHLMFRSKSGGPMLMNNVKRDENQLIESVNVTDNLAQQFERLVMRLGSCEVHGIVERRPFARKGMFCPECEKKIEPLMKRGFYCLRHTATTFASSSGASSDARSLFEGHSTGGVRQAFYLDPSEMHDLLLITRELRSRLVLTQKPSAEHQADASVAPAPSAAEVVAPSDHGPTLPAEATHP
jgi:hypothetical protein